jgi:hypothetical protein
MTRSVAEVARRFVGSYLGTNPDPHFEELYAPKVLAWHNFDAKKVEYHGNELAKMQLERLAQVKRLMPNFRIQDFTMHVAESAFIFVQTWVGTLPDGTPVRIPGVVVWEVKDGQIITVNAVGDFKQREAMERALAAAAIRPVEAGTRE